ncbi:MAG: ABC transporter ATP-binding protein [Flavobacteriales bacterium]
MIEVKGISKFYSQKKALEDVDLNIQAGKIFGLIGPNGAGKTTLIRILNQIIEPSSGQVLIGGIPLNPVHVRSFGYLPEERGLYREMKVRDHLVFLARIRGLGNQDAHQAALHWLEKFEILPWSKKRIDALSKGMAQKVQFIGSMIHDPQIVILDEPLSGFDPLNIQLILNEIKAMKALGKTIIFSTHNMNSVDEICDEVGLINQGKVVAHDKVSSLKDTHKNGAYKVRYKGNQIAFANALWTGFEIISTEEIGDQWFQSIIKSRHGQSFNEVYSTLSPALELQLIEEQLPGMQDVFLKLVTDSTP